MERERFHREEPEKRNLEQIISAKTPEGKEIVFNLKEIREHWINFYREQGLEKMADALPEKISLNPEQIKRVKDLAETEGFNSFLLLPKNPDQYLELLKEKTAEETLQGLRERKQYYAVSLPDALNEDLTQNNKTLHRPKNKPYLLFIKDSPEVDKDTLDKSADEMSEILKEKKLTGLTLADYFVFQREFTQKHRKEENAHPDSEHWTWLLDSEVNLRQGKPNEVLHVCWIRKNFRLVLVTSSSSDYHHSSGGARTGAVFELLEV